MDYWYCVAAVGKIGGNYCVTVGVPRRPNVRLTWCRPSLVGLFARLVVIVRGHGR